MRTVRGSADCFLSEGSMRTADSAIFYRSTSCLLYTSRGQDPDIYVDFALYGIIFSIIGARIYYVFFQWGYYKDHLLEIVNLRKGGLAIYGGVIAGILTLLVFTKKRHLSCLSMADSACLGLVTGQMIEMCIRDRASSARTRRSRHLSHLSTFSPGNR